MGGILCALLGSIGCQSHTEEHHEEVEFTVTTPLRKDTLIPRTYVGQIHSINHIELRALEGGYLQKIYVDEGQFVRKGQLLFQILPVILEAEQQKAEAEVNFAEIEYQNTKSLADSNVVSKKELALAKAQLEKAKAELVLASARLGFTEIRAPFDGIMDQFHVRVGSLVEEGELLTTLSDNSKMWVYFNVPEVEYLAYQTSKEEKRPYKVKLLLANNELFEFPGVVETIEAEFNTETGNIAFRATFPNSKRLLRHGQTGNILIETPIRNAMLIPQKATFEVLEKKYVFVVDVEGIVQAREVKIEAELPHIFVVHEGLEETDKILLEGLRHVKDRQKIRTKMLDPQEVMSHLELYAE